ncbi:MAG: hypothetical protein LC679_16470 [Intrasporangiaceae bacterium]|nr:hypothetical protein [Intrasporangiaceae bacterium]
MSHPLPPPDTSGSQPNDIRVVIVDDHDLIRTALRALLSSESDIEVCGDASGGEAGATLVLELPLDSCGRPAPPVPAAMCSRMPTRGPWSLPFGMRLRAAVPSPQGPPGRPIGR